ncbi:tRNA lysidine(34) synthetase TilS [Phenylobacterium sp.]|uniref:tRNA lysidine(34) synthetase TilS n=1 Tax=Phenylobacterium sp. TaxID=1871053 RepID=UPI0025D39537|nr:tRNA lysidine(34) synthetase TilS [Phenylobacterium sp.]
MLGLARCAPQRAFQRHLLRDHPRPVAVALSGGGDSLALALIADGWARAAGRPLLILTVDHGLQADATAWTTACAEVARRLGHPFRALAWQGPKPTTGLPAAARQARHALLADAAREAGARVILLGHTADDLAETVVMRAEGATTPDPREWAPSPAWPQGRGVFLLRPLLEARRADLRDWLKSRGETWIEDPANADLRYARSRARRAGPPAPAARIDPPPLALAGHATEQAGIVSLDRAVLRAAPLEDARRFVALACVCAGGGDRRPASPRIARAAEALRGHDPVVATLAGARLEADAAHIRVFRETGELARGGLMTKALTAGRAQVWDGRFELTADDPGYEVRCLAGLTRRLPSDQQRSLRDLPAAARGGMPALVGPAGAVTGPALTGAESLVGARLAAAAGLVDREPE